MYGLNHQLSTAENYRQFGRREAAERSPAYERLALLVADNALLLEFLGQLPADKRQPNLLFAAARYLLGTPADADTLLDLVAKRGPEFGGPNALPTNADQ
jgi:Uncharacterized protein conserved in bacteria (DUF2332)